MFILDLFILMTMNNNMYLPIFILSRNLSLCFLVGLKVYLFPSAQDSSASHCDLLRQSIVKYNSFFTVCNMLLENYFAYGFETNFQESICSHMLITHDFHEIRSIL